LQLAELLIKPATSSVTFITVYTGAAHVLDILATSNTMSIISYDGYGLSLYGAVTSATGQPGATIGNSTTFTATSGTQTGVAIGTGLDHALKFAASGAGSANFLACQIAATINTTAGAQTGAYTGLNITITETALDGMTGKLIDCYAGSSGTTAEFSVDNTGNILTAGRLSFTSDTGISRLAAGSLAIGNGTAGDYTGSLKLTGLSVQGALTDSAASTGYVGAALLSTGTQVQWGVPSGLTYNASAVAAAIGTTTLFTSVGVKALYRISAHARVTQAATNSATLGPITVSWTDAQSGAQSQVMGCFNYATGAALADGTLSGNVTTDKLSSVLIMDPAASTAVTFTVGYASSGATPMQYSVHITAELIETFA
jgi:hypothetical protein